MIRNSALRPHFAKHHLAKVAVPLGRNDSPSGLLLGGVEEHPAAPPLGASRRLLFGGELVCAALCLWPGEEVGTGIQTREKERGFRRSPPVCGDTVYLSVMVGIFDAVKLQAVTTLF